MWFRLITQQSGCVSTEVKDRKTEDLLRPVVMGDMWCHDITVRFHSGFDPHQWDEAVRSQWWSCEVGNLSEIYEENSSENSAASACILKLSFTEEVVWFKFNHERALKDISGPPGHKENVSTVFLICNKAYFLRLFVLCTWDFLKGILNLPNNHLHIIYLPCVTLSSWRKLVFLACLWLTKNPKTETCIEVKGVCDFINSKTILAHLFTDSHTSHAV